MKEYRILIVEDEYVIALDAETRLKAMGFMPVGIAANFDEAIIKTATESPDLVMMDINISGTKTGIDAAKVIWEKFGIPVVYVSGVTDSTIMEEAMATRPMGYILKPFKDEELKNQLLIALQQKTALDFLHEKIKKYEEVISTISPDKNTPEILFIKDSKQIFQIQVQDIAYLEAMDNYTLLYTHKNDKYVINGFLKDIVEKIPAGNMIRIHRSYAVAKQHIKQVEENTVTINTRILPISKSYRDSFYQAINPI